MASQQGTVDFICEQLAGAGAITWKRMFGEFGVYCDGTFIGVICNDTLFLKITRPGEALAGELARELARELERLPPYQGAKPSFCIDEDLLEDPDRLSALARATRDALAK